MLKKTSWQERLIFICASMCFIVFGYLVWDDQVFLQLIGSNKTEIGEIILLNNDVRFKDSKDFKWNNLARKTAIYMGDGLFTGDQSTAKVRMKDGSEILIDENSMIYFSKVGNDLQMSLQFGQISEVKSTTAVMTTRKGNPCDRPAIEITEKEQVLCARSKSGASKLKIVTKKETLFEPPKIEEVEPLRIPSMEAAETNLAKSADNFFSNQQPVQPMMPAKVSKPVVQKSAGPSLKVKKITYEIPNPRPLKISWSAVADAKEYQIDWATNSQLIGKKTATTEKTSFEMERVSDRQIFYRVYGLVGRTKTMSQPSELGEVKMLAGKPNLHPIAPLYDSARSPSDEGSPKNFELSWSSSPLARAYEVQWSPDPKFSKPQAIISTQDQADLQVPKASDYFWRVRVLGSKGEALSEFSDAGKIVYSLTPPLAKPMLTEPNTKMTLFFQKQKWTPFFFAWKKTADAEQYQLEVSKDPLFQKVIVRHQPTLNQFLMPGSLPPGTYFWRVRAHSKTFSSQWSETRQFDLVTGQRKTASIHE